MLKRKEDLEIQTIAKRPRTIDAHTQTEYTSVYVKQPVDESEEDALSFVSCESDRDVEDSHNALPVRGTTSCIDCPVSAKKLTSYGFTSGRRANKKYCCAVHGKLRGMVRIRNTQCIKCNKVEASFGFKNGRRTHCATCKENGMISIGVKLCTKCGESRAAYGIKDSAPTHCSTCREEGMIDLKNRLCVKCNKIPSYGMPGKKPTHCSTCKEEGMIIRNKSLCAKCNTTCPSYGMPDQKPTHCFTCREEGMTSYRLKNKGKCMRCRIVLPRGQTLCTECTEATK